MPFILINAINNNPKDLKILMYTDKNCKSKIMTVLVLVLAVNFLEKVPLEKFELSGMSDGGNILLNKKNYSRTFNKQQCC